MTSLASTTTLIQTKSKEIAILRKDASPCVLPFWGTELRSIQGAQRALETKTEMTEMVNQIVTFVI